MKRSVRTSQAFFEQISAAAKDAETAYDNGDTEKREKF